MTRTLTRRATPVMTRIAVPRKEKSRNLRSSQKVRAMRAVTTAPTPNGLVTKACPIMAPPSPFPDLLSYESILVGGQTEGQDRHTVTHRIPAEVMQEVLGNANSLNPESPAGIPRATGFRAGDALIYSP